LNVQKLVEYGTCTVLKKDDVNTQALVSINGGPFLLLTFASFGEEGPPLIEISACV
jgi:hypothetical protein